MNSKKNEKYISEITGIKAFENWDRDVYIQPSMINFNGISIQCSRSFVFNIERIENKIFYTVNSESIDKVIKKLAEELK